MKIHHTIMVVDGAALADSDVTLAASQLALHQPTMIAKMVFKMIL